MVREKPAQGGGLFPPTAGDDHVPERMHGGRGKQCSIYSETVYSGHSLGPNQLAALGRWHDHAMKLMA